MYFECVEILPPTWRPGQCCAAMVPSTRVTASLLQDPTRWGGGWRLEAGGWRLEAGGWRLEGRGQRAEGRGQRAEGGGQRAAAQSVPQVLNSDTHTQCMVERDASFLTDKCCLMFFFKFWVENDLKSLSSVNHTLISCWAFAITASHHACMHVFSVYGGGDLSVCVICLLMCMNESSTALHTDSVIWIMLHLPPGSNEELKQLLTLQMLPKQLLKCSGSIRDWERL